MKKKLAPILSAVLVVLALFFGLLNFENPANSPEKADSPSDTVNQTNSISDSAPDDEGYCPVEPLDISASYTSKENVALFITLYHRLPDNFITKSEARKLGWDGGSLEPYAPGMCIGGDRFGNYEGLLPEAEGRYYTECDIDTLGKDSRGAKRIVFSNDGLIYYTEDHYESFQLIEPSDLGIGEP